MMRLAPPQRVRERWSHTRSAARLPASVPSPIPGPCPSSREAKAWRLSRPGCRRTAASESTLSAQYSRQRARQNLDIQEQRPILDVLRVESHDLLEIDDVAPPAHLPQSGYAWLGAEAPEVTLLIGCEVALEERARPHQRHLADKDIPQLR